MGSTKVKTGSSKGANKRHSRKPPASTSKAKSGSKSVKKKRLKEQSKTSHPKRRKARQYTEAELEIPPLNMITPAGVEKSKGKEKGKVFIDDQDSMMTILAMVNADKDGQIESKMIKELLKRQMEEIREARRRDMEARSDDKNSKFEARKNALRRKGKSQAKQVNSQTPSARDAGGVNQKRVSFAQD